MENQTAANRNRRRFEEFFSRRRIRPAIAATALLVLTAGLWVAVKSGETADQKMRQKLIRQAVDIANGMNAATLRTLSFTAADKDLPLFRRMCEQFQLYAKTSGISSIYTMALRKGQIVFGPSGLPDGYANTPSPGTVYQNRTAKDFELFQTGRSQIQGPIRDEYGTFVRASAPITDSYADEIVAEVCVEGEASGWKAAVRQAQWIPIGVTVALLFFLLLCDLILEYFHRNPERRDRRTKHMEVSLCAVFMMSVTLALAIRFDQTNREARRNAFDLLAHARAASCVEKMYDLRGMLNELRYYFESSPYISREEFRLFCNAMSGKSIVEMFFWAPAVPGGEVSSFVDEVRNGGFPDYSIWQKNQAGGNEPVALCPVYYPALYVEPLRTKRAALGYDLNSEPRRSAAIREALNTGLAAASDPVQLITATNSPPGLLVFLPVNGPVQKGLVAIAARPENLLGLSTQMKKNTDMNICLFRLEKGAEPLFIAGSSDQCGLPCWDDKDDIRITIPAFRFGKAYTFRVVPGPSWLAEHPLRDGWFAFGVGLLLTLLTSFLTTMIVNRRVVLERMVEDRTAELKRTENNLSHINRQSDLILSSTAEGVLGLNSRGVHTFINAAAAKMLGYEIEELIGRPSHSLWHHTKPDGTRRPQEESLILATCRDGEKHHVSDEVFWRKDGSSFPVEYNSIPILEYGQPAGAVITFADITERRRTEELLTASEARFRDIAVNTSDWIWEMDAQGMLRYVSEKSIGLLGYTPEELIGTTLFVRMHAKQAEAAKAFYAERFKDHKPFRGYENWIVRKDGTPICMLSNGMPMFSDDGTFIGYRGTDTDITARKWYEEDIRQSVSLLEATLDATADGVLVVDGKGKILRHNQKFIEMWRIPDAVVATGSDEAALDFVLGQLCEPEIFLTKVKELYRHPEATSFDVLNFNDGRVFERYSQPQRVLDNVVGRVWSFHDVTKREQAEALLWASQTKLDLALQSALMGVWQWDVIRNKRTYDRHACSLLGINPTTFVGTAEELLSVVHPDDRQKVKDALARTIEQHAPYDMEHRVIWPDGSIRHIASRAHLFLDDGDRQLKVTGVCWDVTDRRKAEERMRLLAMHLQTVREEERKRIARELHDDIGQILTAIKIDLASVEAGYVRPGDTKNKMGDIQQLLLDGIKSVHSLCRQLRPGALDDLSLSDALEGLIDDWKNRNQMECALCADVDDEVLSDEVKTAAFRMTQEALTNVSRYAQASKVEINLVSDEQTLNITISDDGCGMEPGAADKPTSFGLLGMRERVETLGGTLCIESAPGKGTRIEATIPLTRNG